MKHHVIQVFLEDKLLFQVEFACRPEDLRKLGTAFAMVQGAAYGAKVDIVGVNK